MNFTAATGPDFKRGFVDPAPVSNVDVGRTMMALLNLLPTPRGHLTGRVLREAMPGGTVPRYEGREERSQPAANGLATVLQYQQLGGIRYLDAGGFPDRTLGIGTASVPSSEKAMRR